MKCMGCANAVHNGINGIDGVKNNQITLDSHKGEIVVGNPILLITSLPTDIDLQRPARS